MSRRARVTFTPSGALAGALGGESVSGEASGLTARRLLTGLLVDGKLPPHLLQRLLTVASGHRSPSVTMSPVVTAGDQAHPSNSSVYVEPVTGGHTSPESSLPSMEERRNGGTTPVTDGHRPMPPPLMLVFERWLECRLPERKLMRRKAQSEWHRIYRELKPGQSPPDMDQLIAYIRREAPRWIDTAAEQKAKEIADVWGKLPSLATILESGRWSSSPDPDPRPRGRGQRSTNSREDREQEERDLARDSAIARRLDGAGLGGFGRVPGEGQG